MSTNTVEETLAWEAEQRPRAATAAIAGGLLTVLGNVLFTLLTSGGPTEDDGFISVTEALQARIEGHAPEGPSFMVRLVDYWGDNAVLLSVSTILTALAAVCLGLTVLFLYRATAARTEAVGRVPYYATIGGLVLYPLGRVIRELGQWIGAANFQHEAVRTAGTARDVLGGTVVGAGSLIELLGTFALAVAIVLVSLNAMRAGLLTRFFGVLGMLAGVLTVFQADQPGIVRAFWLIGVGLVIAGRLSAPPAWHTGRAEPWPTQQQLREQREAARAGGDAPAKQKPRGEDAANGEDASADDAKPAHTRKKRKHRR